MIPFLVVFNAVLFLVSAWMLARAGVEARKSVPLQFTGEPPSRNYVMHALFDRSMPPKLRRRLTVSSILALAALAGFALAAWLAGNPAVAVMLLLICGFAVANIVSRWRRS